MNIGEEAKLSNHRLITTVGWSIGENRPVYASEGSAFIAGAVVQWLRDGLQFFKSAEEIEDLAGSVPDNGGVYLVPAFVGLGAPHWDADARGLMIGLTRGTTRAHIARAALEGIAFQCAEVLDAMGRDARMPLKELRVDGGASRNNLLMQFQADLSGVSVPPSRRRPLSGRPSSRGSPSVFGPTKRKSRRFGASTGSLNRRCPTTNATV